jgi:enoyl-CoA hydratase/carnithine racemase
MADGPVGIADRDGVRVLTLSRPGARNALDTALLAALVDALADAVADDAVRALVLTGAGEVFSAGADLQEPLDSAGRVRRMELLTGAFQAVAVCPKGTVAAVGGPAIGGGAELAAACDVRVAAPGATFRFPGAAFGFPVGPAKLVGLVGLGAAKDLVLTARTVGAEEAARLGLVQRLTPPGGALDEAVAVAAAMAANDPRTVAYLKRQFDRFSGLGDRVAAEADGLLAHAASGGDLSALTARDPKLSWRR